MITRLEKTYGLASLLYGIFLLIAGFGWSVLPSAVQELEQLTIFASILGGLMWLPALISYTKRGLNTDASEQEDPIPYQRHRELRQLLPSWPLIWYGMLILIGAAWLLAFFFPGSVHPFVASAGSVATFAGIWTLLVNPIARKAFPAG